MNTLWRDTLYCHLIGTTFLILLLEDSLSPRNESLEPALFYTIPIILKTLFLCIHTHSHCRESSRVVLIPFQAPQLQSSQLDDSQLLRRCRDAGDAVPIFVKLGKMFETADRSKVDQRVSQLFSQEKIDVTASQANIYHSAFVYPSGRH